MCQGSALRALKAGSNRFGRTRHLVQAYSRHKAALSPRWSSIPRSLTRKRRFSDWTLAQRMGQSFSSQVNGGVYRAQDRQRALNVKSQQELDSGLWIVAGLGNPGTKYEGNRHNVGFKAVDRIASRKGQRIVKVENSAAIERCNIGGTKVLLVKPMTFMNNSGEPLNRLARYYKVPVHRILVIYDDLDTPVASVKLKSKGGHGGHNGIRSINSLIKGDYPRIKIGIGRPAGQKTVITHVLQDFSRQESEQIDLAIEDAITIVQSVLSLGLERALSGMRVSR